MTLNEYKNKKGQGIKNNKKIRNYIYKILVSVIFTLVVLIVSNINSDTNRFIKKYLFETTFNFSNINKLYNKYFLKIKSNDETIPVSNEKYSYTNKEDFNGGVSLTVGENYNVKLLQSGIVIFVGETEEFGKTLIVQQSNGIDVWYGNIAIDNIKIYDYVEKDTIIGIANDKLYLGFQKDGEFLDYNEYI